jgi:hypothetical protein
MRIVPSFINEEQSPPGEILIYNKLQQATRDWTVIHSLDLAPINRMKRTEIDFLIIIPKVGLVCVEVKSHREIGFDGHTWYPESVKKSPFQQAMDARYALQRRISSGLAIWKDVPVVHCCIFPNASFSVPRNLSVQPFEVMDRSRFRSLALPDDFCAALLGMVEKLIHSDPQIQPLKRRLSDQMIDQLIEYCFPIRKRRPEKEQELLERSHELEKKLRIQQKPVLQLRKWNPRILLEGGAGTGKTLIGLEVARREAEQGKRTAFLTFNNLVGKWAQAQLASDEQPLLVAGPVNSVLLNLFDITVPKGLTPSFWNEMLSDIQDALTRPGQQQEAMFDYLVIDEAQDFLGRPELFETLELLLVGGFREGHCLLMGDFQNQVLTFDHDLINDTLNQFKKNSACWKLGENCRNYAAVGNLAISLSDASDDTYSGYMRTGGGLNSFKLATYKNIDEQIGKIDTFILGAIQNGFKTEDITLLSYGSASKSCITELQKQSTINLQAASETKRPGYVQYTTAHAYKGLENKVILLTDVDLCGNSVTRNLFYTAITRATEQVFVLCSEDSKQDLLNWINQKDLK